MPKETRNNWVGFHFRKPVCLTGITSLFILFLATTSAQPVKRIYLANDDHTDYMWTANEARYDTAFVKMLDYYLDAIDATKNNADDFQARFNCGWELLDKSV